jgi:hypothetical protein
MTPPRPVRQTLARRSLGQIFAGPILVGLFSVLGLVSALVGDGFWDGVSWVMLLIPVLLGVAFILRGRRR